MLSVRKTIKSMLTEIEFTVRFELKSETDPIVLYISISACHVAHFEVRGSGSS